MALTKLNVEMLRLNCHYLKEEKKSCLSASEFFSFSLSFCFLANFHAALNFLVLFVSRLKEQELIQKTCPFFVNNTVFACGIISICIATTALKIYRTLRSRAFQLRFDKKSFPFQAKHLILF